MEPSFTDSVSVSVSVIPFPFPDSGFRVLVLPKNYVAVGLFYDENMKLFLKYNFFFKETKDPFLHGDFDSMRVTVENALLSFTAPSLLHSRF